MFFSVLNFLFIMSVMASFMTTSIRIILGFHHKRWLPKRVTFIYFQGVNNTDFQNFNEKIYQPLLNQKYISPLWNFMLPKSSKIPSK